MYCGIYWAMLLYVLDQDVRVQRTWNKRVYIVTTGQSEIIVPCRRSWIVNWCRYFVQPRLISVATTWGPYTRPVNKGFQFWYSGKNYCTYKPFLLLSTVTLFNEIFRLQNSHVFDAMKKWNSGAQSSIKRCIVYLEKQFGML